LAFKDAFSSGMNDAKSSLADMKGALDEINQNQEMNRLAADMAMMTSMTDPMRKALSNALDQPSRIAGSLDSAFKNIQVSSGNSAEEMAVLRQELLAVGGRAVAGPKAVADAYGEIAGGIADASARMDVMNAAISLAEANQADLSVTTNALVNVMNAWGLSADDASIAADILTQTANMGVGSLDEFSSSISHLSALSASAGVGLDELGAAMAFSTTKGLSAGAAQKQLKSIMTTLMSPSENLSKLYTSLGIESGAAMLQEYGLADSLGILKNALGGNEAAFADIIGSADALTVALGLTEDEYLSFAQSFSEGMVGVTEAARGVQLESIEQKMARLQSVSDSLQAQIGGDINGIKGFFIDMKFGFLSNVVSPIMSSPVGGAMSKIFAVTGMGAKAFLDMGSGALNAASQIATVTTTIQNAGGIAKLFSSTLGFMKGSFGMLLSPLKAVGTSVVGFIANLFGIGTSSGAAAAGTGTFGAASAGAAGGIGVATGATTGFAASLWAATWPILAVVAGIALVAGGVYLLVKNWTAVSGFFGKLWDGIKGVFSTAWNWIKNLIFGASDWILGAVALFMPIVGIPALIIKHWDQIKGFFSNLWSNVTGGIKSAWDAMPGFFSGVWSNVTAGTTAAWNAITGFFSNAWDGIKGIFSAAWDWVKNLLFGTSDWILGAVALFMPIVGIPALIIKHWDAIKEFFINLWNDPKATIMGFIDWLGGIVGPITAPFKAIGDVVGGAVSKIGGFFKGLVGGGKESGSQLNDAFAEGIQSNAAAPAASFGNSIQGIGRQMPHSDAQEGPLSELTSSGRALTDTFASGMDDSALEEKSSLVFSQAMPDVTQLPEFGNTLTDTLGSGIGDISLERNASLAYTQSTIDTGSLSDLTAQGNSMTDTLTSGISDISLEKNASLAYAASMIDTDLMPGISAKDNTLDSSPRENQRQGGSQTVHIENLYLQADDCQSILDFVRMIMHSVNRPEEVPV
jgi:TP901 family phage tail tape measure protein